eukprot:scaffold30386_cov34-Tisochrysis_lutea.AAC.4
MAKALEDRTSALRATGEGRSEHSLSPRSRHSLSPDRRPLSTTRIQASTAHGSLGLLPAFAFAQTSNGRFRKDQMSISACKSLHSSSHFSLLTHCPIACRPVVLRLRGAFLRELGRYEGRA